MLIGVAAFIGMVREIYALMHVRLSHADKDALAALPGMRPGHFRAFLRAADQKYAEQPTPLTQSGERPGKLYLITNGETEITKNGQRFTAGPGMFIGEVSFNLGGPASACVTALPGCAYLEWDVAALHGRLDRDPSLKTSVDAQIGRDMARKIAETRKPTPVSIRPTIVAPIAQDLAPAPA